MQNEVSTNQNIPEPQLEATARSTELTTMADTADAGAGVKLEKSDDINMDEGGDAGEDPNDYFEMPPDKQTNSVWLIKV